MKQGDKLYQIQDGESPYSSSNTLLVTALLTLGAQLDETQPYQEFREVVDGQPRRQVMWLLKEKTLTGVAVQDLVKQWRDEAWLKANPESPLAHIKCAIENYRQLVIAIKSSVPVSIVRRGRKLAIIPKNASPDRRTELLNRLTQ